MNKKHSETMKIPTKVYNYRLPYMGSKNNIAYSLMLSMLQRKPKAKYFYDVFGGGASMSLMAAQFGDHDPDEVIIYCDPPYRGTAEYIDGGFNFKEFDEWFKNLPYTGFLSEYSAPFEKVASFGKMALLNNNSDKKKIVAENLYWNGK